ncbi:hypothetical protein [Dactylosporangium salmoneum]
MIGHDAELSRYDDTPHCVLAAHMADDGVWFGARAWIVSARWTAR